MRAVHFGAGNIGRGFIGEILHKSGYEITFVDVNDELIADINRTHSYTLYLLDHNYEKQTIDRVNALSSIKDEEKVIQCIVEADLITTSVWANNLPRIAPTLAKGLQARMKAGKAKVNVLACENAMFGTEILRRAMADCSVDMSEEQLNQIGCYPNTAVDRVVLGVEREGRLAVNVADYHELAIEQNKLIDPYSTPIQGARYTDNLQKFLERKLYVVNCGHAWAGYIGYIHGYKSVRDVFLTPEFVKQVRPAMCEAARLIQDKYGFSAEDMQQYVDFGIKRFQADGVDYDVNMVTRSPIRKLGVSDRLVGPCVQCAERGLKNEYLLKGIALVFLLDREDDAEAVQLQLYIKENGIDNAIEHFTGIQKDEKMHKDIIKHYYEQKAVRDQKR